MSRAIEQITIPSPIDIHTHLREPGGKAQETIASGTLAALAGGYQMVSDMPNNATPYQTWTRDRVLDKQNRIERTAYTHAGVLSGVDFTQPNFAEIPYLVPRVLASKFYMGFTTNNTAELTLEDVRQYADQWIAESRKQGLSVPIFLHARGEAGAETADYIARQNHPVHWCHVSDEYEAGRSRDLTMAYSQWFSAGVTPHHLTMTQRNADYQQGWNGARMMPPLGGEVDAEALLHAYNQGYIQVLETDHAPHTAAAKLAAEAENPAGDIGPDCTTCFGVSGIEHSLGIMAALAARGKTSMERVAESLYDEPLRTLRLEHLSKTVLQATTTLELGPHIIGESDIVGASANTPYLGWTAGARVTRVERYRKTLYDAGTKPRQGEARFIHQTMGQEVA